MIGIYGLKQSGKDFTAQIMMWMLAVEGGLDVLLEDFLELPPDAQMHMSDVEVVKFAGKLKRIVSEMIGCSLSDLENEDFKNLPLSDEWQTKGREELTPRRLLQKLGTDLIRDGIHVNTWVNATMSDYDDTKRWIITDMRFPNEIDAVKKEGGITIIVSRRCDECLSFGKHDPSCSRLDNHSVRSIVVGCEIRLQDN